MKFERCFSMIQNTKKMEKMESLCQLIWCTPPCVRKMPSSPQTCCPAEQARRGCSPRKRATSPKNKAEEAQGLSTPAVFPFFYFFCRKTGQLGCEHRHSRRAPSLAAPPQQCTALPTVSAHPLWLRCQTSACCPAMAGKDPKLSNWLLTSKHET